MFDSLTGLIPLAWRPARARTQFSGSRGDALPTDELHGKCVGDPFVMSDPTAPIRVPLNWLPTPEQPSPTQPEAGASR